MSGAVLRWKHAANLALNWSRSKEHYQDHLSVTAKEHMSGVDCFDGQKARSGEEFEGIPQGEGDEDLLVVSPVVDGRLRDEGRN
jgi:5'-nucleotidase